tara:strand:- start:2648 stop:3859 length:1212 start_codon:yes stop_codon:yes gene_type:complete
MKNLTYKSNDASKCVKSSFWVPELDGLRAIACFMVLIAHFNPSWLGTYSSPVFNFIKALNLGTFGVVLFFSLSSFLLTSLALKEVGTFGKLNVKEFYIRRILRIWPLYFLVLFISALTTWDKPSVQETYLYYVFFIGNWIPHTVSELGILWTISVEEQFYLVFPFLFSALLLSKRKFLIISICFILSGLAIYNVSKVGLPLSPIYYHTSTYITSFVLGAWAAILFSKGKIPDLAQPIYLIPLIIILGIVLFYNPVFLWEGNNISSVLIYLSMQVIAVMIVIYVANSSGTNRASWLRYPALRSLGVISYGIYLFHVLSHAFVNEQGMTFGHTDSNSVLIYYLLFILYISSSISFAAFAYMLWEQPFLKIRRRTTSKRDAFSWIKIAIITGTIAFVTNFILFALG